MNDDFDDLDRALFALPLDVPPAGMREAILRVAVPAPRLLRTPPLGTWDIIGLGIALAVAVWLVLLFVWDKSFATTLTLDTVTLLAALGNPTTLLWLSAGGAVAAWMSLGSALPFARGRS